MPGFIEYPILPYFPFFNAVFDIFCIIQYFYIISRQLKRSSRYYRFSAMVNIKPFAIFFYKGWLIQGSGKDPLVFSGKWDDLFSIRCHNSKKSASGILYDEVSSTPSDIPIFHRKNLTARIIDNTGTTTGEDAKISAGAPVNRPKQVLVIMIDPSSRGQVKVTGPHIRTCCKKFDISASGTYAKSRKFWMNYNLSIPVNQSEFLVATLSCAKNGITVVASEKQGDMCGMYNHIT